MTNYDEEMDKVIDWLCHPSELGMQPSEIEYTSEFTDEDGIHCTIFKYKKDFMSPWMLAISSDSGVFSQMEEYHEETEIEDAKALVEFLKEYWKRMANDQNERKEREQNAESFSAFVLLNDKLFDYEGFEKSFLSSGE